MSSREKSPYYGAFAAGGRLLFADLTEEERIADMAGVPGARKVRRLDVILAAARQSICPMSFKIVEPAASEHLHAPPFVRG